MPSIEIDETVMHKLQMLAIKSGKMHFTANDVLRDVLKLGATRPTVTRGAYNGPATRGASAGNGAPTTRRKRTGSGSKLLSEHIEQGVIPSKVRRGYYHLTGRSYATPREFPAALFSPEGYVIINSEDEINDSPHINRGVNINIPDGISNLPGFVHNDNINNRQS